MTRENLNKISNSVKKTFAKLVTFNGYKKDSSKINPKLIMAYSKLFENNFKFGAANENIRVLKREDEEGIVTIEANGLSYRSFVNLENDSPFVSRSIYVKPGDNEDESYITARFFAEDSSFLVLNAKTQGKRNEIKELCLYVYDSENVIDCMASIPNFNPAEIGEDIKKCMIPSKILILLNSAGIENISIFEEYIGSYLNFSEVLVLKASSTTNGEIPFRFALNAETLTSMFDTEKRKKIF